MGALLGTGLMAACAPDAPTALPDPPAPIERPAEYAFGDDVAAREERVLRRVTDALGAGGRPRETRFVAPAGYDLAQLERFYAAQAEAGGWAPVTALASALDRGAGGVAYTRDGETVALVWLRPEPGAAAPVTMLRFGG